MLEEELLGDMTDFKWLEALTTSERWDILQVEENAPVPDMIEDKYRGVVVDV